MYIRKLPRVTDTVIRMTAEEQEKWFLTKTMRLSATDKAIVRKRLENGKQRGVKQVHAFAADPNLVKAWSEKASLEDIDAFMPIVKAARQRALEQKRASMLAQAAELVAGAEKINGELASLK